MHIGILQCGHTPPTVRATHGDYADMFKRLFANRGWSFTIFDVSDMEFPDGPDAADGWLVTGSKHGAYEDLPFIAPLEVLLREIAEDGRPMVGICFGHQIIAQAFGGRVEKFAGGWGVGPTRYDLAGVGEVCLTAWHQDQVTVLPDGAQVIARNDFCGIAGLAYGDRIVTLQPHPELGRGETDAYITARLDDPSYPDGFLQAVRDRLDTPLDISRVSDWLADVLTQDATPDGTRRHG